MFKLEKYGIRGQTYKWFTSYLTDRSQSTIVNGIISELHDVRIGIPQGSVLGPILFLLFVNDLPMFVSNVTTFADDTMIEIRAKNVNEAIIIVQNEIDKLSHWCVSNKLTINVSKSCSMLIGCPQRTSEYCNLDTSEYCNLDTLGLTINGETLCNKAEYTYLGLKIDSKLSWNSNVISTCK